MNFFAIFQKIWFGHRIFFFKYAIAFRSQIPAQRCTVWFSCVLVCFGLSIALPTEALAVVLPHQRQLIVVTPGGQLPDQVEIDLEAGAKKAEEASDDVFKGFEQTKEQIGKTQTRKQGMERGRQKASATLKELSDRATDTPEKLESTDKLFLKNLRGGNLDSETRTLK